MTELEPLPTVPATGIGEQTCVGVGGGTFPYPRGNCFCVLTGGGPVRVLNFVVENLEELLGRGVVGWPVRVHVVAPGLGYLNDERIPHAWYRERVCEICCPTRHLPLPQRLAIDRDIRAGRLVVTQDGTTRMWWRKGSGS